MVVMVVDRMVTGDRDYPLPDEIPVAPGVGGTRCARLCERGGARGAHEVSWIAASPAIWSAQLAAAHTEIFAKQLLIFAIKKGKKLSRGSMWTRPRSTERS